MSDLYPDEKLMTRSEVHAHFGLTQRYLEELAVNGGGPAFVRLGRAVRYRAVDIRSWISARREHSNSSFSNMAPEMASKGKQMKDDLPLRIVVALKKGGLARSEVESLIQETEQACSALAQKSVEISAQINSASREPNGPKLQVLRASFANTRDTELGLESCLHKLRAQLKA